MLAIRPPAYFPGLRYMAHLQQVDHFVLADTVPYRRRSSQRRSRLRNPQGWQWISVPLRAHQQGQPLYEAAINDDDPWKGKHWRALQYNYRSTPYFEFFESQIEPIFEQEWDTLGRLTCATVELLHDMMDLATTLHRASELDGAPGTVEAILEQIDDTALVVDANSADDESSAVQSDYVFHFDPPTYYQNFSGFEPDMSAVDLIFNYGPEAQTLLAQHARVESRSASE